MAHLASTATLGVTPGSNELAVWMMWYLIAGIVQLVAIVRTIRLPAPLWTYRKWSKIAAVIIAAWFVWTIGVIAVPLGAIAVIWHTRTVARRAAAQLEPPELPFAEGVPSEKEES